MEISITGYNPFILDAESHERLLSFWGESEIQEFWSGASFSRPDDGSELSYHLSQLLVQSLAKEPKILSTLVLNFHFEDAGEKAFQKEFNHGLGEIIGDIFGEGNWTPKPEKWKVMPQDS